MPAASLILDLDGTLLDTNGLHVRAWEHAFAGEGFRIARERIEVEIGKGGDLLVPAILGAAADESVGDRLRDAEKAEYGRLVAAEGIALFPGAVELIRGARTRGISTALATSSDDDQLDAAFDAAGTDLRELVDVTVTADDAAVSKPAPDVVLAAAARLGADPSQCVMVGDTRWDGEACSAAGVAFLGLLCGGTADHILRAAGARGVWRDPAHLLEELDAALQLSPSDPSPRASPQ